MRNQKNLAAVFTEPNNYDIIVWSDKTCGNGSGPVVGADFKPVAA